MRDISSEDKDIASEFIILNSLIQNLEHDRSLFNEVPVKLSKPYDKLLEHVTKNIRLDLMALRKVMKQRGIRVLDNEPIIVNEDFHKYRYVVRGYEYHFSFFIYALRNYQVNKLYKYLGLNRE